MSIFVTQIKRNLTLHWRRREECWHPLLFFILVCVLFPLATNTNPHFLRQIGVGVIWVSALLATLLSLPNLFKEDFDDGCLEQVMLSGYSMGFLVLAKVIAEWIVFALPLIVITPLLALMFDLPASDIILLIATLLLATPVLYFIGAMVAALTVGLPKNGLLLALLLIPLYIPTLIFAANSVLAEQAHHSYAAPMALLGAFFLLSLIALPFVSAFALRLGVAYGR